MAIINGSGGSVVFSTGTDDDVFEWSIDYNMGVQNVTSFDDGAAAAFIGVGITEWSGSYQRYIDSAANPWATAPNLSGSATFTAATGETLGGTIITTGSSRTVNKTGGAVIETVNFQGTGALTITSPS